MDNSWIQHISILDRTKDEHSEVWYPFAVDELLSEQVSKHTTPICHLWTHASAVILGQRDSRLSQVKTAIETLEMNGYNTCVRHSGGAAVPLDKGVLNISLIFPIGYLSERTYNDGFEKMFQLIQAVCEHMPYRIQKGEIVGAYCPGEYDLSVNGFKFCGIAQRRKVNAYIVQAFINISGDSIGRGRLIKSFYDTAATNEVSDVYPTIVPETIASLAQFGSFKSEAFSETSEVEAFIHVLSKLVIQKVESIMIPSSQEIEQQVIKLKERYRL